MRVVVGTKRGAFREEGPILSVAWELEIWLPGLDKLRNWLRDPENIFRGIVDLKAAEAPDQPQELEVSTPGVPLRKAQ